MIIPTRQDKLLYKEILWQRPLNLYQTKGRVFILGGEKKPEKVITFLDFLYNCHIRKITFGHPESFFNDVKSFLPDSFSLSLPQTIQNTLDLKSYDAIIKHIDEYDLLVIGVGLSQNEQTKSLIRKLSDFNVPIIFYQNGIVDKSVITKPRNNLSIFILEKNPKPDINQLSQILAKNAIILLSEEKRIFVIKQDRAVVTDLPKNDLDLISALTVAFWSQNIKKPFESACTACFAAKQFLQNFNQSQDIVKAINLAEKI